MGRNNNLFVLVLAMVLTVTAAGMSACIPPGPAADYSTSPLTTVPRSTTGIPPTVGPGTPTIPPKPAQSMLQLAFAGNRNGPYALFLINADGSGEKQITPAQDYVYPAWSPDGTIIAADRGLPDNTRGGLTSHIMIVLINLTNGSLKDLTAANHPDFSPYGNLIVCNTFKTVNLGGAIGQITPKQPAINTNKYISIMHMEMPRISPDGDVIAFAPRFTSQSTRPSAPENLEPGYRIAVVDFDGTNLKQLTTSKEQISHISPSWSPDGKKIVFMSSKIGGKNQISVMNADGSGQTQLTNDSFENHDPAWSPDGNYIAYVSDHSGISELLIIRPDGTGRTRINRVNELVKTPAWRPLPGRALGQPPTITASRPSPPSQPATGTTVPSSTATTGRLNISCSGSNPPYSIYVNGALVGKDWANLTLAPGSYRVTTKNSKGTTIKDENSVVIAGKDSIVKVGGAP